MENLTKAKAQLITTQPFFATLLLSMKLTQDDSIKTLSVNADEIKYNSKFISELTVSEVVFALSHEIMHVVFEHVYDKGKKDHNIYNQAGDYIINDILIREKIGLKIQGALHNSNLVNQGKTTNGVYDILYKKQKEQNKNNNKKDQNQNAPSPGDIANGGSLDDCQDSTKGKDAAEISKSKADSKVKIINAANAAKMCGNLPASIKKLVDEIKQTDTNWKAILREFFTSKAKTEYSYARPKRRFLADDIYLPSLTGEKIGCIVIAIDMSGSINQATIDSFSAEINAIKEDVQPELIKVLYFDTEVKKEENFTIDDDFKLKAIGGGGTKFSPIFKHLENASETIDACIVLTDLYCSDFGQCPDYPVLWASNGSKKANFGEVVSIK